MKLKKAIDLIIAFEGLRLNAYRDAAGIPTIGYGTTYYPNGQRVKMGDKITMKQAMAYLSAEIKEIMAKVIKLVSPIKLTENQLAALVSFVYNVGIGAFKRSTLLKRILENVLNPLIIDAFLMWNKVTVDGKKVPLHGLTIRRKKEAKVYFENTTR